MDCGTEMEMKMEPSSPTDKRQQFSRCSSTNSVITSNSSAHNSGKCGNAAMCFRCSICVHIR